MSDKVIEVVSDDEPVLEENKRDRAVEVVEAVMVPIGLISPNEWNPFEQEDPTFNMLVEEIEAEGFDEPILVVPIIEDTTVSNIVRGPDGRLHETGTRRYKIVNGEHRWKAARVLEIPELPCSIKVEWDERTQKVETVRRNLIRGAVNPRKFTNLVEDVAGRLGIGAEAVGRKMGFFDEKTFAKVYLKNKQEAREAIKKNQDEKKAVVTLKNMTVVLNEIFRKSGNSVPQNYVSFVYQSEIQLMVSMDGRLKRSIEALVEFLAVSGMNACDFLHDAIERKMLNTSLGATAAGAVYDESTDAETDGSEEGEGEPNPVVVSE